MIKKTIGILAFFLWCAVVINSALSQTANTYKGVNITSMPSVTISGITTTVTVTCTNCGGSGPGSNVTIQNPTLTVNGTLDGITSTITVSCTNCGGGPGGNVTVSNPTLTVIAGSTFSVTSLPTLTVYEGTNPWPVSWSTQTVAISNPVTAVTTSATTISPVSWSTQTVAVSSMPTTTVTSAAIFTITGLPGVTSGTTFTITGLPGVTSGATFTVTSEPTVTVRQMPDIIPTMALTSTTLGTITTPKNVKTSAGNVYGIFIQNAAATVCWAQLLNSQPIGTLGTAVIFSIPTASGSISALTPGDYALSNFSTGISVGLATTATGATACGTAGNITLFYK